MSLPTGPTSEGFLTGFHPKRNEEKNFTICKIWHFIVVNVANDKC